MRRTAASLVVLLTLLASGSVSASAPESEAPVQTTYEVLSRTGGLVRVSALEWMPTAAETVLLAVHGSSGVKENNWGPLSVRGYSFAHSRYREGRAAVAIDLPSYGSSEGNADLTGVEDFAFVVDQIADVLRERFEVVVGAGHSVGALVVDVAQGVFRSFDAIIAAGWSHGGYSQEAKVCAGDPDTCGDVRDVLFVRKNADPQVVEDVVMPLESYSVPLAFNIGIWGGTFTRPYIGPSPDDITATIDVPVFIVLGTEDSWWDRSMLADEPSHFPGSNDVTLVLLRNTGHMVFHHLNNDDVQSKLGAWLDKRHL